MEKVDLNMLLLSGLNPQSTSGESGYPKVNKRKAPVGFAVYLWLGALRPYTTVFTSISVLNILRWINNKTATEIC